MSDAGSSDGRLLAVLIPAVGGQGGGVLSEWLVEAAAEDGFPFQGTSIPGVAQRTGATTYYVELYTARGAEPPAFSLYPVPGAVDVLLAPELLEAGRMVELGFVSPERTTVVCSTHRIYSIHEKVATGRGIYPQADLERAVRGAARALIAFDALAVAREHGTEVNALLLGALAGSGALPLSERAYRAAIERKGVAVAANLKGFELGLALGRAAAAREGAGGGPTPAATSGGGPAREAGTGPGLVRGGPAAATGPATAPGVPGEVPGATTGAGGPGGRAAAGVPGAASKEAVGAGGGAVPGGMPEPAGLATAGAPAEPSGSVEAAGPGSEAPVPVEPPAGFAADLAGVPDPLRPTVGAALARLVDYQDRGYARGYLERLRPFVERAGTPEGLEVARRVARYLAVWMTYEDAVRVAQLKTRRARFERIRREARVPGAEVVVTDYLTPDLDELYGVLPARLVAPFARWAERRWPHGRPTLGQRVRSTTVGGYLRLRLLALLRPLRPISYRARLEHARIDRWLEVVRWCAERDPALGAEVATAARLVKGYGEVRRRLAAACEDLLARVRRAAELEAHAGAGFAVSRALAARYAELVLSGPAGEARAPEVAAAALARLEVGDRAGARAALA